MLTVQAQAMGRGKTQPPAQQEAPKRKQSIMGMNDFIKSQGLM